MTPWKKHMFGQGEGLCRGEGEDKGGGCVGLCIREGYYGITGLLLLPFSSRNSGLRIGLLLLLLEEKDEQSSVVCKFCV